MPTFESSLINIMKTIILTFCYVFWGLRVNAQRIDISHPERKWRASIEANTYVMFEYEFINADKISKWGIVKGKILEIRGKAFLLEQGSHQNWFDVKRLWAMKELGKRSYLRSLNTSMGYGADAGGGPTVASAAEAASMIGITIIWGTVIGVVDLIQHSNNFRFTQSKGWEFDVID
jgi:hypothetical protein